MASPFTQTMVALWRKLHFERREALITVLVLTVASALAFAVAAQYDDVVAALILMLGVTIAGALAGLLSALLTAVVAFFIFNFYLTEPALVFRLATGRDIAPLVIFNLCALVSGILAGRLRDHAGAARRSNDQLNLVLAFSAALDSAVRVPDILTTMARAAHAVMGANLALYRVTDDALILLGDASEEPQWRNAAGRAQLAGLAVREGSVTALPFHGNAGTRGILVLDEGRPTRLDASVLDLLANITTLALERAALFEQLAEKRALARAEELKTALLSSVSHDLRTPLTAISASASSLIDYHDTLSAEIAATLLQRIVEECDRLNRYTANLLEMSRIEAGGEIAPVQTLSVSEMIGAALQRLRGRLGDRDLSLDQVAGDLLVRANPSLFELVLTNILDNAVRYSAAGTRIAIGASCNADQCEITIADAGLGIPAADLARVFDRFYRVPRHEASPKGSGLGLAIAKGFVEALDGTIEARTPGIGDRGTTIVICLPLVEEPVAA